MKLVILESPYAGQGATEGEKQLNTTLNLRYARNCVYDCLKRGESPIASHLLFTQEGILNDNIREERNLGITAGLAWLPRADYSVYYTDRGWSTGMLAALHDHTLRLGLDFCIRSLTGNPRIPTVLDQDIEDLLKSHVER